MVLNQIDGRSESSSNPINMANVATEDLFRSCKMYVLQFMKIVDIGLKLKP